MTYQTSVHGDEEQTASLSADSETDHSTDLFGIPGVGARLINECSLRRPVCRHRCDKQLIRNQNPTPLVRVRTL